MESRLAIPRWIFGRDALTRPGLDGIAQQFDLPLILTDKMFSSNGEFRFDDAGHTGLWGDVILVNGVPWPKLKVYKRKYRFRILNAGLSRGYRLQLGDGTPFTVIGTDGGLMPQVQTTAQLRIGMAERYEVVIDFSRYGTGAKVELRNLGVPNSVDFDNTGKIMQFEVVGDPVPSGLPREVTLPTGGLYSLNPNTETWGLSETAIRGTTRIQVVRDGGAWKIQSTTTSAASGSATSGRSGSDDGGGSGKGGSGDGTKSLTWQGVVLSNYREVVANPASGDVQVWEITNRSGGWFHPVHIHLVDFKILSRNGRPAFPYEQGPKDVVYVGENETVRAIMRFGTAGDPSTDGRYMIHCHNLPHEDHDMMTQFRVGRDVDRDWSQGPDSTVNANCNDPINADPATPSTA